MQHAVALQDEYKERRVAAAEEELLSRTTMLRGLAGGMLDGSDWHDGVQVEMALDTVLDIAASTVMKQKGVRMQLQAAHISHTPLGVVVAVVGVVGVVVVVKVVVVECVGVVGWLDGSSWGIAWVWVFGVTWCGLVWV